jgi:alcohol dehydrogenase
MASKPVKIFSMRAAYYSEFNGAISIENLPDPSPPADGVVIRVEASGVCRSDWHGWQGHDPDITLPHVPGHELSGVVEAVGRKVKRFSTGDRVTLPFVCGCGTCRQCVSGNHQVCDRQFQPGFTHWGSFAERVAIEYADINLVRLPDAIDFVTAASLGCRFATAFRAVVDQGSVGEDQWVAVHGCGGVGLSAVMIAAALGAHVVAIDISSTNLEIAAALGAKEMINPAGHPDVVDEIRQISGGGVSLSLDAVGFAETCFNSVACLSKRGKHVQVGLMTPGERNAGIPMDLVVARELEILGSHGMQAHRYPQMLDMIVSGQLQPQRLVKEKISLENAPKKLVDMDQFDNQGISVINRF